MAQTDINHPPPGGFVKGAWYWNPQAGQAQRWTGSSFGAPGQAVAVNGEAGATTASSPNPLQDVNTAIQDSFQKLQNQASDAFTKYTSANPFNYDQVLAAKTASAKEQIDPYYNQLLGDYLTGVTNKINRGAQDTQDLLSQLSSTTASYVANAQNNAATASENANQNYADSGLTNSGASLRAQGQIKQSTANNLSDFLRGQNYQQNQAVLNQNRNVQDTNLASNQYQTNLAQQQGTDVATRAGQLTKEAGQSYIQGFQQTLPTQLQSASGFDMLKSLGIYS